MQMPLFPMGEYALGSQGTLARVRIVSCRARMSGSAAHGMAAAQARKRARLVRQNHRRRVLSSVTTIKQPATRLSGVVRAPAIQNETTLRNRALLTRPSLRFAAAACTAACDRTERLQDAAGESPSVSFGQSRPSVHRFFCAQSPKSPWRMTVLRRSALSLAERPAWPRDVALRAHSSCATRLLIGMSSLRFRESGRAATLTLLEIVLGIDNVILISILAGKLPEDRGARHA